MKSNGVFVGFGSVVVAAVIALSAATSVLGAPPLEARKSDEAGVQVVVTPKPYDPAAATWDFDVIMDTHTKPLGDDLVRISELIADGRSYTPAGWQGDPPGGHHRKGVIKFTRPAERPKSIEIRINGIGGAGMRKFKWN